MVADDTRRTMVVALADAVTSLRVGHPTRVAIDGRSAREQGREVLRASIDDFHRPGHKYRSQRDGWTPQSYFEEGYDYDAFRDLLLQPLDPEGSRRCRLALFDAYRDVLWPEAWQTVSEHTVAIIDGVFLLRPELADHWDYIVWLDIDLETMVERARHRDVAWVGSAAVVEERYRRHWIPTHERYERLIGPRAHALAVIDNRRPEIPRVLRLALSDHP